MPTKFPSTRALLLIFGLSVAGLASPAATVPALAKQPAFYTTTQDKLALSGYDPVAYFTTSRPVKGNGGISASYGGAIWYFSSEANRAAFQADPAKYAPQFGGYCAWAVSQGYTASGDPEAWKIVGGKLYVNYDKSVAVMWSKDIPGNIAKGNANWPKVLEK